MSIYSNEFEAWFAARFWHECYEDVKHHLFAAWQESRQSLVIDLPSQPYYEYGHAAGFHDGVEYARKVIQLTGAKVK